MKRKIDKTLKEVRRWKREVAAKVRRMTPKQRIAFYNASVELFPAGSKKSRKAA